MYIHNAEWKESIRGNRGPAPQDLLLRRASSYLSASFTTCPFTKPVVHVAIVTSQSRMMYITDTNGEHRHELRGQHHRHKW